MKSSSGWRRIGLALALTAAVSTASPPAARADFGSDARAAACEHLANLISHVESLRQTRLREFVLNLLRKVQAEFC